MRKSTLIALSGIIAALSIVVMLIAYFPYFTYAMPAIAGCFLIIITIETGSKYAFLVYATVSVLSFFVCEKEAAVSYILFFGYYPIIKEYIERIRKSVIEWIIKLLIFNITFFLIYYVSTSLLGIDFTEMGNFGKYSMILLFSAGNVMYVLYDIALTKIISQYIASFRNKLKKYIG